MAKQIQASPSNKKISELYKRIKEGTLKLQPEFQRKFVWNSAHKELFIETILMGLPFPEIYIAQSGIDIEKIETQEVIVDGQQRLSTIVQYIDELEDSEIFGRKVKKFKNLLKDEQTDFVNYNVVIRDLGDISSDQIKEVFKRINQTKYSLEQIEIQNAVYDGEFIMTAKDILTGIDATHIPIFSESELSRMADLHFILLIMATIENGGYFPFDKEIEKYIIKNNDEYQSKEEMKNRLLNVFEVVKEMNFLDDSIWYRKSNFFTLITELTFAKIEIMNKELREKLLKFEDDLNKNKGYPKDTNDFTLYYSYMYTGTNSRQARVIRSEIFRLNIFA